MLTLVSAVVAAALLVLPPAGAAQTVDTLPPLGVAGRLPDGVTCMAAPSVPASGRTLHAVQVPLNGSAPRGSVMTFQVGPASGISCVALWGAPGDSAYVVTPLSLDASPGGAEPTLVLLDDTWMFRATALGWHLIHGQDRTDLAARACTSAEGIHLTLWAGAPLTGRVVWHRYYYLGYDVEPSCTDAEYGK